MSQERVSGFPEKGADLRGSPGTSREVWGSPGEVWGTSGGKLWIAVKFHSERTSGEVAGKLPGKFGELPGKSGDFPEARGSLTPSQRLAKFVSNGSCNYVQRKTKGGEKLRGGGGKHTINPLPKSGFGPPHL